MNSYDLSRSWFNFCFDNPEKVRPVHSSIYFFAIEHCNRLGWKEKFGFPSQMVMEAIGVKNWRTYSKALNDIVSFGFINMIEISKNQYSSNIIAIVKNTKAPTKALDKALQKHGTKQCQSTVSIDKQYNNKQLNNNNNKLINENIDLVNKNLSKWIQLELSNSIIINNNLFSKSCLKDSQWMEVQAIQTKSNIDTIKKYLDIYEKHLITEGLQKETLREFKSHFNNWLRKQEVKKVTPKKAPIRYV